MRWRHPLLMLLLMLALGPAQARVPLPEAVRTAVDWQLSGAGEMRFFGWRVYEAALWRSKAGEALAIRYQRAITAERLVRTTLDEMDRLGVEDPDRWREALAQAFPDVAAGDVLVARRGADGVAFYAGEQRTLALDDPEFAAAFFAIWLDPRTREPGLRAALLGEAAP
jgi:hypothetical protein